MWNTFKYTVLTLTRERGLLLWALAFPLVLASLFSVMFSGIDEAATFEPIPVAVVADAPYQEAEPFRQMIETLSAEGGENQLLATHSVDTGEEAQAMLENQAVLGYYTMDSSGEPTLHTATSSTNALDASVNQTILKDVTDNYARSRATLETLLEQNPAALNDPTVVSSLFEGESYTTEINVLANSASGSIRYFYALLGFSSIMIATIGTVAISRTQANLSPLGARRVVGATSRSTTLISTFLAAWILSLVCLLLGYCYMRFVLGISFGGRDLACLGGLLLASLMTTSLGAAIGSIPKLGEGVKTGILSGLSALFGLFAGLFGEASQALGDALAANAPVLQMMNPSRQVTDLFFNLYYFESLEPFWGTVGVLLTMTAVLLLSAGIFLRRQRYASI